VDAKEKSKSFEELQIIYCFQSERDRTTKLGHCHANSTQLSEDEAITVRKYPLLADAVPNVFGRALGHGSDHYNQIVVLESVPIQEGNVDVLYVGTDQGNVIKMANLVDNGWNASMDTDPIHQVAVFQLSDVRTVFDYIRLMILVPYPSSTYRKEQILDCCYGSSSLSIAFAFLW
jgi:hypothetical protein